MTKYKCPICKGTGRITVLRVAKPIPIYREIRCDQCNGNGKILLPEEGIQIGEVKT